MNTKDRLLALLEWGMTRSTISRATVIPVSTISRLLSGKHKGANEANAEKIRKLYDEKMKLNFTS